MNIEDLLAIPGQPMIRVRVGPGVDDVVEIDQLAFENQKQAFIDYCLTIPNIDGAGWRILKPFAGNNGLMAKVLIGLGEVAGIWKMHPPPEAGFSAWGSFQPMIAMGSVIYPTASKSKMPKPSRGDLEVGTSQCECCERTMGPAESLIHDLRAVRPDLCEECNENCPEGGPCQLFRPAGLKRPPPMKEAPPNYDPSVAAFLEQVRNLKGEPDDE